MPGSSAIIKDLTVFPLLNLILILIGFKPGIHIVSPEDSFWTTF